MVITSAICSAFLSNNSVCVQRYYFLLNIWSVIKYNLEVLHSLSDVRDSDERKTECPSNKNIGRPTKRLPMLLMERVIGRLSRTRKCMLR